MKDVPGKRADNARGVNGMGAQRDRLGRFLPDRQDRDRLGRFDAALGPHSPEVRILAVDRRTVVGKLLTAFQIELTEHCGGADRLSFPQRMLIRTASVRAVRLSMLEAAVLDGTASGEAEHKWTAHASGLRRDLVALGLDPAAADDPPRLRDLLAAAATRGGGH